MFKKFVKDIREIDNSVLKIINYGLAFSSLVCLIGTCILLTYSSNIMPYNIYTIGLLVVKIGLSFGMEFFVCGFVIDKIKKEIA